MKSSRSWLGRSLLSLVGIRKPFEVVDGPLNMKGASHRISRELLSTKLVTGEPMKVHALSGSMSTLFVCEYPERGETLLLDAGTPADFALVDYYVTHETQTLARPPINVADGTELSLPASSSSLFSRSGKDNKKRLTLALSTHCHVDHIGSIESHLKNGTQCMLTDGYEHYYAGYTGSVQRLCDMGLALLVCHRLHRDYVNMWSTKVVPPHPALVRPRLADGVSVPGYEDWLAIHTPGHTAHMVALYHPASRILYAADNFVRHKGQFWSPIPVDIPYAYSHTLHRLRGLDVSFALLPHGGIVNVEEAGGWNSILDDVVQHAKSGGVGGVVGLGGEGSHAKEDEVKKTASMVKDMVKNALIGWSSDAWAFTREKLPRRPLPQPCESPSPVYHLR
jgi:glyoxylase-like metal-dependent hydrolase (beta-lactamase superfamily II)